MHTNSRLSIKRSRPAHKDAGPQMLFVFDDCVGECADAFDLDFHNVARLEEDRRLALETDASGGAHGDHITRLEINEFREMISELRSNATLAGT
jgi:hypothetical protein